MKDETCPEFVERIWGRKVTNEELEGLMWQCTAFPFVDVEILEAQLIKVREQSGGDYDKAMEQADKAIKEAMKVSLLL